MKLSWGVAALSLAANGCSFTMNTAPSAPSERTREAARECTSSFLYPALDSFGAAVGGYNIGISAIAEDKVRIYGVEVDKKTGMWLGVGQIAAFGAGAVYGFVQASRCNRLRHERHVETDGEAEAREQAPAPSPPEPDAAPSAAAGETTAPSAEIPAWSAFRRVPFAATPPTSEPLPQRFTPP